jgi:hypothetical protein
MEKYTRIIQDTEDNIIRPIRFAYWITKATDVHSEYVVLMSFHGNRTRLSFKCICTVPVLFYDLECTLKEETATLSEHDHNEKS